MRAAPAARSPCDAITPAVNERRAGVEPCPYERLAERGEVGRGRTFGSSRTPTPTAGGRRPVRHVIYRESIPRLGGNVVRPAWTVRAGRRGRRPLQGGCDAMGPAVIQRPGGGGTPPLRGGRRQARVGAERPPAVRQRPIKK